MKVLLTGFEPFGGETTNPAWEAVQIVPDRVGECRVVKAMLPCVFGQAGAVLDELMTRHDPDVVLCVGQAGGRATLTVEQVAINLMDAVIPDNQGGQPVDEPVFAHGETAYFSNLPVKAMVAAVREAGVPAAVSYTAGTYVCNYVLYHLMHRIQGQNAQKRGGFVHVPFSTQQGVNKPPATATMEVSTMAKGLSAAIASLSTRSEHDHGTEGTIC